MNKSVLKKIKGKAEYEVELKECRIKIGGKNENTCGKFVPNLNMSKWGGECWLNINRPLDVLDEFETFDNNELVIKLGNEHHKYYIDDNGRLEYEIELTCRPSSNEIKLELDFPEGLEFGLQPSVSTEDSVVPENVRDSYAVYWKERNNKYKTGKFCHIYRIKVIDKNGNWNWCKQRISGKIWLLMIPQDFLDTAVYPIVIDPVLGYDIIGGSSQRVYHTMKMGQSFMSPAETGIATLFHAAVSGIGSPATQKFAIYDTDQVTENPDGHDLIDGVETVALVSDDNQVVAQGGTILASTKYWIGSISESSNNYLKCDFIGNSWIGSPTTYASEWRTPFDYPGDFGMFRFSIWIDYEVVAEGAGRIFSEEGIHSRILR